MFRTARRLIATGAAALVLSAAAVTGAGIVIGWDSESAGTPLAGVIGWDTESAHTTLATGAGVIGWD
ncbi:hypothetical protein [Streptomyces lavenduligriseus]|uniref:Uncharacterized protein n=1 Tax=Streptomyces lavenduligriseus TaxID=67315 RepID=A0ABT0P0R0_9ACTN|nr:hypothetical protein [Streptomyces lavenduligriseus]MCL3997317.1 hypothetical protein [Streptomyces lavenduligriseus]